MSDILTLRPNAPGSETSIVSQYPASTYHWDKVDEDPADDFDTYVEDWAATYKRDLYNLPNHTTETGIINSIKIYFRLRTGYTGSYAKPSLRSNSTVTDGTEIEVVPIDTWITFSQIWTTNPADGEAWEWADIDALQIGASIKSAIRFTQVYVEIDYTPVTAPTVTTEEVSDILMTTATGNGTITNTGGENCHTRGICYMEGDSGDPTTANDKEFDNGAGSYGTGAYSKEITGLTAGTSYRVRAYAINSAGTGYGITVGFITSQIHLCKPNPWGRIRGKLSLNPEQALRTFGFVMNPLAHGVILRQYVYYDDNNHPHTGTFISNYFPASNPKSVEQTKQRKKMQKAVTNWHTISEQERQNWNRRARGKHMSGFNFHNRYHLFGIDY